MPVDCVLQLHAEMIVEQLSLGLIAVYPNCTLDVVFAALFKKKSNKASLGKLSCVL